MLTIDESGMPAPPSIRQMQDKDILSLYSRDTTKDKRRYIAEAGVIYYLGDPKSPAKQQGLSDEEGLKLAIENYGLEKNYVPDKLVRTLIKKYYISNITEAGVALESLQKSVHLSALATNKINDLLNQRLATLSTPEDITATITLLDAINKRVTEIPALTKAIGVAYDNLRDEEEQQLSRGGNTVLSSMDADEDIV